MNRILLLLILLSCSSCYTFHVYPIAYRHATPVNDQRTAYVLNPELQKEYQILAGSGIFHLVADSTTALKIKLYPIVRKLSCGQGTIVSMITLGQVPVSFPDWYSYKFDELTGQQPAKQTEFQLSINERIWFWDLFVFHKKFAQKAGKALLGEYQQAATK